MNKCFLLGLIIAILPNMCFAESARYTALVREKQRKMEELEKCMGSTKGLKIAGLSTLGLTAVGVAGNIAEAKKIDEYQDKIDGVPNKAQQIQKQIDDKDKEIKKLKGEEEQGTDNIQLEIKTLPNGDIVNPDMNINIPGVFKQDLFSEPAKPKVFDIPNQDSLRQEQVQGLFEPK